MAAEFTLVMTTCDGSRDTTAWVLLYDPEVFVVTGGVMFLAYPFATMDDALSVVMYDDLLGRYMDDTQGFVELVEDALDGNNALGDVRVRRVGEGFRLDVEWFPVTALAAAS